MVIICIVFMITLSYIDWDGFKVIKEYENKGLLSVIGGFIFGTTYLLVNRDIKKTYILLFIMFAF